VFLDIVHEAFFTFIPFYSTPISVILFVLIKKHGFPCACVHETFKYSRELCAVFLYCI